MYDIEDFLDDVETILQEKLNGKIASIAAEKAAKGKPVDLDPVDFTNNMFKQELNLKVIQGSPTLFFGLQDTEAVSSQGNTGLKYRVFVEMIVVDSGNDPYAVTKVHRYSRALREIFEEAFADIPYGKLVVEQVRPVSFRLEEDTSDEIRVGGVSISTVFY